MRLADLLDALAEDGPWPGGAHPSLVCGRLFPGHTRRRAESARAAFARAAADGGSVAMARHAAGRMRILVRSLAAGGVHTVSFSATTATRLITGAGGGLPEVNVTLLHGVHGFPYLPGSGLKGVSRAEAARSSHPFLVEVFGGDPRSEGQAGGVRFLDAVPDPPSGSRLLELDVATVHHKAYYEAPESQPIEPTPTSAPVPLPFLVVPAGTRFRFLLAARPSLAEPEQRLRDAFALLRVALVEEGMGAATSSGYGYFADGSFTLDPGPSAQGPLA